MLTLTCLQYTRSPQTLGMCSKCYRGRFTLSSGNVRFMERTVVYVEYENSQPSLSKVAPTSTVGMPSINIPPVTKDDDIPSTSIKPLDIINEGASTESRQKNKKRCWTCRVKLELAQRELGVCKCGRWFLYSQDNLSLLSHCYINRLCVLSSTSLTRTTSMYV